MYWGKLYAKVASRCAQSRCFCSYRQILLLTVSGTTIWHKIILFTTAYVPMVQAPVMSVVMPTVPVVSSSVTAGISFSLFPYLWHNCQFFDDRVKNLPSFLFNLNNKNSFFQSDSLANPPVPGTDHGFKAVTLTASYPDEAEESPPPPPGSYFCTLLILLSCFLECTFGTEKNEEEKKIISR